MQTTSFQGISPQFTGIKPNSQSSNVRQIQTPSPIQGTDTVRFGNGGAEETKESSEDKKPKDPNFLQKSWRGVKQGFGQVFQWKSMALDVGIGALISAVLFIFPPHIHGLVGIPMYMTLNGMIRFARGAYKGFKGEKAG